MASLAMIRDGLAVMAQHYLLALSGVDCRFDVDEARHPGRTFDVLALALVLVAWLCSRPALQVGAVLVGGCACWARALLARPDRVIEWRAYSAIAGVAMATTALPWQAAMALAAFWAVVATRRAWCCRSELAFRRQAAIESPAKLTAQGNYANALVDTGAFDDGVRIYRRIVDDGTPAERETADGNLTALLRVLRGEADPVRGRFA